MPNMTGLGKYQKGMELEEQGLAGKEVAAQLGYKDVQSWYAAKSYYAKRNANFAARAAGVPDTPKPNTLVEEINRKRESYLGFSEATRKLALATKAEAAPENVIDKPRLQRTVQVSAEGETLRYRLIGELISIYRSGQHRASLSITVTECLTMIEEVKELLRP